MGEERAHPDERPGVSDVLVVLPTYDERESLPVIVRQVLDRVPEAELLVVDDASPDGTGRVADALAAEEPRVRVLHRAGKAGLGSAYVLGFREGLARGHRFVVEMDADGSHRVDDLVRMLAAAREPGAPGLVIGARWVPGGGIVNWPRHRRWISRTGTRVARLALRSRLHDITSGFRVIDTSWLSRLDLDSVVTQGYGFQVETAWMLERLGCPIAEIPIVFVERGSGRSKMTFGIVLEALVNVLKWGLELRLPGGRAPRR